MTGAAQAAARARALRRVMMLALAAFIAGFWLYVHLAPPGTESSVYDSDPELAYFVSSLAVFKGHPYVYVHHPGTPLAVLGSALLALTYPFPWSSPDAFVARSVRHPAVFIILAHGLLVLANVACVIALGWKAFSVRRPSDAVLAAAVPASYFTFLPQSFFTTFYWSHNAIAFPFGTLLLLAALRALRRGRPPSMGVAWALGLAVGALAATQMYFAVWALGPAAAMVTLALLRPAQRRRALATAAAVPPAAAVGFAVCTLPILPAYARFVGWLRSLAGHQGRFGSGPAGFTSWTAWTTNVAWLWDGAPALFVATAVVFAMLLAALVAGRSRWRRDAGLWAVAAGVSLQWAVLLILMGKHASRSYLPAVAAMLPILLAIAFTLSRRARAGRVACLAVTAVIVVGCARAAVLSVAGHARRIAFRSAMEAEVEQYLLRYAAPRGVSRSSVLVLWGPGVRDAPCYGLWAGDAYSDGALRHEISAVCPAQGLAWSNQAVLPDGWPAREEIPAVVITTEDAPRLFPAFAALGAAELSVVRDPAGRRLAFHRVIVKDGVPRAAAR